MKVDIEGVEAFVVIAELHSFSRAALALHISQSALSRRLKKLEQGMEVQLLQRTTQQVALTALGRSWLPQALRLLQDYRAAVSALIDQARIGAGRVTVACIPTAAAHFLPRAVSVFERRFPDVRVRVLDQSSPEVLHSVREGAAEFGIAFVTAPDSGLAYEPLFDDPLVLVCRRDHPLAGKRRPSFADLAGHRVARVGSRSGTSLLLDLTLEHQGVQLNWWHEAEYHFSSALGLAERGSSVAVLPRLAFNARGHPDLIARPLTGPAVSRQLGIVRRPEAKLSEAAQGLVEAAKKSA